MTAIMGENAQGTAAVSVPEITYSVEVISSSLAAQWLELYKGPNRRINDAQVLKYQSDMESGRWFFEASPLRISNTGKLLDGQHRLTALANTVPELEFPFLVVRGLVEESQLYMDMLHSRTVGQQLSMRGVPNSTLYAAITKLYLEWTRGRLFRSTTRGSVSKPESTKWVLDHLPLLEAVSALGYQRIDAPPSVVGAFALAIFQIDPEAAQRFIEQLVSGVGLTEGDPILALDRRLRNIRRTGVRVSQREYLAYLIKAWNAWLSGTRLQKLQLTGLSEDTFPTLLRVVKK